MASAAVPLSKSAAACEAKMRAAGVNEACIRSFLTQHAIIESAQRVDIPESTISSVDGLNTLDDLGAQNAAAALLEQTVVLKLNGGLGTSMGLNTAKSLLSVKDGKTFLDFTALQIEHLRKTYSKNLRFMLMNSFSTSSDTKAFLKKYSWLHDAFDTEVEVMQNRVPKISQDNLFPAIYELDPSCEWAPPGHGDLYTALYGSGTLDELIRNGYRYMFVSNSDNLGATLDPRFVAHMEANQLDFVMEVCERTDSDKKGGHLAYRSVPLGSVEQQRRLILRESAQCPKEDEEQFQDIKKHRFFNTNNLWVNLLSLKETMVNHHGMLPLPVICNAKTVNPTDGSSMKVFQLETAMGAAIALFDKVSAVVVPRDRFAPVKTCADLLALRSDAYIVTGDQRLVLHEERCGKPPIIDLDSQHYKAIDGLENLLKGDIPSLLQCTKLTLRGLVEFGSDVVLKGEVRIYNSRDEPLVIERGRVLIDEVVEV